MFCSMFIVSGSGPWLCVEAFSEKTLQKEHTDSTDRDCTQRGIALSATVVEHRRLKRRIFGRRWGL